MKHKSCNGTGILHGEICVGCAGRGASESDYQAAERKIATAIETLETLRRMAADPMKSWDSGRVIDAQRVDELCEDALSMLRPADPTGAEPGPCERCGGRREVVKAASRTAANPYGDMIPCPSCAGAEPGTGKP